MLLQGCEGFCAADFTPKPCPGNDSGIERGVTPACLGESALPTVFQRLTLALAALAMVAAPVGAAPAKKPVPKAAAKPVPKAAPKPVAPPALPDTPEIAELRRAFRFAFPIYEVLRTRTIQLARAEKAGVPDAVNILLPKTTLVTASDRDVTTPNNDTLYASAWLDLSGGPQMLTVPGLPGRYHSAALMSLQTDNTAILGTRTGGNGGRYMIVGPGWKGDAPQGAELVRSATNDAWLLVRVVVNGDKDLQNAAKALAGFTLTPVEGDTAPVPMVRGPAQPRWQDVPHRRQRGAAALHRQSRPHRPGRRVQRAGHRHHADARAGGALGKVAAEPARRTEGRPRQRRGDGQRLVLPGHGDRRFRQG